MRRLFLLKVFLLLSMSSGCARTKVDYVEVFRDDRVQVRLAQREERSGEVVGKGYEHPWNVQIGVLDAMLESVRYKGGRVIFGGAQSEEAFPTSSRQALLTPLQKAFAQAGPDQAVDFSFIEHRSMLKVFQRVHLTDGIMFCKGGKLNIAFRNLACEELGVEQGEEPNRADPTASPVRSSWTLVAGDGQALAKAQGSGILGARTYTNWLELDLSWPWGVSDAEIIERAMPGMGEALDSALEGERKLPKPTVTTREEVQKRLEFLEELYREGAVSEADYRSKKRELMLLYEKLPE
jgi:hypothetical protein